MKTIKKIVLENFQIHKKLTVNLHPNFNVIFGDNEKGKSSIVRAVFWVIYNTPRGDWMRKIDKDGKKLTAKVKIVLDDGNVIKRIKGDKINKYEINGDSFSDIGQKMFEPIFEVFGFDKDVHEILDYPYFHLDYNSYFLVSESNTLKASVINFLTGVTVFENVVRDFNKEVRKLNREVKFENSNLAEEKQKLENFNYIEQLKPVCCEIEKTIDGFDEKCEKLEKLNTISEKIIKAKTAISKNKRMLALVDIVDEIEKSFSMLKKRTQNIHKLKELQLYKDKVKQNLSIATAKGVVEDIDKTIFNMEEIKKQCKELSQIKSELVAGAKYVAASKKAIKKAEDSLKSFVGGKCPVCNNTIMEDIVNG